MSSLIRKILSTPPPMAERTYVDFTDPETGLVESITLELTNDAETTMDALLLDDATRMAYALTYSEALKRKGVHSPVSPALVPLIKLVHRAMVVPDGEQPYDETDIAFIAKTHGDLFFKLVEGASRLGQIENIGEAFMGQQAGNLFGDSTQKESPSTFGHSAQPQKPQQRSPAKGGRTPKF